MFIDHMRKYEEGFRDQLPNISYIFLSLTQYYYTVGLQPSQILNGISNYVVIMAI